MKRVALLGALVLCGCWATQVAHEDPAIDLRPPSTPGDPSAAEPSPAPTAPDPGSADEPGPLALSDPSYEPAVATVMRMPGGLTGVARRVNQLPRDLALIRLTLPAGTRDGKAGVAVLTAEVVARLAAESQGRPALRREIADLGGDLEVRVAATATTFEVAVDHRRWQQAVTALARAMRRSPDSRESIGRIQARAVRDYRRRLGGASVEALIERVLNGEAGDAGKLVQQFEDQHAEDVQLFHRLHYAPRGAVLALWVPGAAADTLLADARGLLESWTGTEDVEPTVREPKQNLTDGIVWAPAAGPSLATILVPMPIGADADAVDGLRLLDALTHSGIDGRLGTELQQVRSVPAMLQHRIVSDGSRRYLALSAAIDPDQVLAMWDAALRGRRSIYNTPPRPAEVAEATPRLRLRLLADHADPERWLDLAVETVLNGGDEVDLGAMLRRLQDRTVDLSAAVRDLLTQPGSMIVLGGTPPDAMRSGLTLLEAPFLTTPAPAVPVDEDLRRERARPYLELAVRAVGGEQKLREVRGYAGRCERQAPVGPSIDETVWFDGSRYRRLQRILATRIETVASADAGVERAGTKSIELSATERDSLLAAAARHPLLLLAAVARGESAFALISTRDVDDREMAVLERIDPSRQRLRVHIDTESGLLRVIETDEWREGVGQVHLHEEYGDYRTVEGMRAPFFCSIVVGDALFPLECQWQQFTMRTPKAAELKLGGPTELPK